MENKYYKKLKAQVKKAKTVFIAKGARVLGDIELGENVSIWYNAVLRADFDKIKIGDRSNVQENVIMHVDPGSPIEIGEDNVIGHGAVLHGCSIGNNNLIGIRATVLNGAKIGNCCIIGAHALVTEGMVVPDYSMVLGVPGKVVKTLPEGVKDMIQLGVQEYVEESKKYLNS